MSAAVLTVIWTIVFCYIVLGSVEDHHRRAYNLPPDEGKFLWWDTSSPARVAFSSLDAAELTVLLGLTLAFLISHPFIGKFVSVRIRNLSRQWERMFFSEFKISEWSPTVSMFVGALWPITMLAIPVLMLGIVIGGIYRSLWP